MPISDLIIGILCLLGAIILIITVELFSANKKTEEKRDGKEENTN